MKFSPLIPLLSLCTLLSACATGYQKQTLFTYTGGYSEKELGRDVYRVEFSANGFTTKETAQCFWLNRCAELALEKGFDGFEILSDIRLSQQMAPQDFFAPEPSPIRPAAYTYVPIYMPMDQPYKPHMEADIHLLKGRITAQPPRVFDARKLQQTLAPHIANPIKTRGNVKPHVHDYLFPEGKFPGNDTRA